MDVALSLVLEQGADAVTIGAVASRAEVTRGLVYKHFANKGEVLAALHLREAGRIDRQIRRQVEAAGDGFAAKFEAYVTAVVEAIDSTSHLFAPLRAAAAHTGTARTQADWNRRTVRYFARLAAADYGIAESQARTAMSLLLGGMPNLLQLVRAHPRRNRAKLEQQYVALVLGALQSQSST